MCSLNRRDFLHDSAALAAALGGVGLLSDSRAAEKVARAGKKAEANDRLRVAVLGVHGQGRGHVAGYAGKHNCEVAVICDADSAVIGPAMTAAEKAQGKTPKFEQDLRRV